MEAVYKLVVAVAAGYIIAVVVSTVFQRSLMYFPGGPLPEPAVAGAADMEVVGLTLAEGHSLVSWFRPPREDKATLVYFHGNAGDISGRVYKVRGFMNAGYGVLLVEYPGFGGNPGSPTETSLYRTADAAMAFLGKRGIAEGDIVVKGESLGSGVATYIASKHRLGALVLEAPYTSTVDVGAERMRFLPVRLLMFDRFPSIDRISSITAPLLISHGHLDRTIPFKFGQRLFDAANHPKEAFFVNDGDHNNLPELGLLKRELDFLEKYLAAPALN
jgi:fermentation-respiration switch protein FrsA (DUF1100 family)